MKRRRRLVRPGTRMPWKTSWKTSRTRAIPTTARTVFTWDVGEHGEGLREKVISFAQVWQPVRGLATRPQKPQLAQQTGGGFGEVGQDDAGAGTGDGGQAFEHGAIVIQPTISGGGDDHRVFAADLVGGDGDFEALASF